MRKCKRWAKATAKKAPIGKRRSKPISKGSATGSINEREVAGDAAMGFAVSFFKVVTYSVETQFSEGWNETQSSNVLVRNCALLLRSVFDQLFLGAASSARREDGGDPRRAFAGRENWQDAREPDHCDSGR
jgi:hypothetical protein